MDAFLHSFALVAIAEMGDKTQLLAIVLAARFRKFWPVVLGILAATLLNHAVASYAGSLFSGAVEDSRISLVTGLLFIIIGIWALVPDKEPEVKTESGNHGAFLTTAIVFFIAEMGDKTQIATVTLGAEYNNVLMVTLGTTLGMMATNIPAVLFGEKVLKVIPLRVVRVAASLMFIGFGVYNLLKWFFGW